MDRIIILLFSPIVLTLLLAGCKSKSVVEEFDEIDKGYDYFPLEVGKFMEYQVDSVVYDITAEGSIAIPSSSYLKELVVDTFRDNANRLIFRIERYTKKNLADDWKISDVWTANKDEQRAERTEENLRFIKMTFPLVANSTWNGNMFIDDTQIISVAGESVELYKSWNYEVLSVGESEEIGEVIYPDVSTLQQAQNENLIELRYSIEKYARGIGLVYREMQILDTQCIPNCDLPNQPPDCFCGISWEEKAEKGFTLRQTMINHN